MVLTVSFDIGTFIHRGNRVDLVLHSAETHFHQFRGEFDDALPLRTGEHTSKARRRSRRGCCIGVLKICRIGPGTRDAQVRRTKSGGKLAKARVGKIDRSALLKERRIDATRGTGSAGRRSRLAAVRLPKVATDDFDHFHVVGLKARIYASNLQHG